EMKMRRLKYAALTCAMLAAGVALAKLPPPTPEEQAAATAKKAKEAEQVEKEKEALARVQDRVVAAYKKEHGSAPPQAAGRTSTENLPKTVTELPGQVGPTPAKQQSAEAHSRGAQ